MRSQLRAAHFIAKPFAQRNSSLSLRVSTRIIPHFPRLLAAWLPIGLLLCGLAEVGLRAAETNKEQVARLTDVLKSDVGQKEKADACRELARMGAKESVAALAELLDDVQLSHMARYGMETIPDPSVDKAFRDALGKLHGPQLVGVIGSIGVRQDAKAVGLLAKFLPDPDYDIAQASARALGKIGTSSAAKALQRALPDVSEPDRLAVYEGLFRCAEKCVALGKPKAARAIYDWVRQKNPEAHQVRTAALRGAILTRGEAGIPLLQESLRGPDYLTFAAAARISQELPGEAVTRALTGELPKSSGDKAIVLLQTLAKRQDPAALPAMFQLTRNGDKTVRLTALRSISEFCNASAAPVFISLVEDQDREIAQAAQEGLAALPGKEADAAILGLLKASESMSRRNLALDLVSRRRMTSALPDVLAIAKGQDADLRAAATRHLGDLAGPRDLPSLIELLNRAPSPADLEAAEQALGAVAAKAPKPEECASALADSFSRAQPAQKRALIRVLGSLGGGAALLTTRAAAKDPDGEVRTTAIRTLGGWGNADPAADLLEMARTCADPSEKTLALRSYLALANQAEIAAETRLSICREAATLVQQDDEKKLLLGALGSIAMPDAMALVAPHLDNAGTRTEASAACVAIADKLLKTKDASKYAPQLIEPLQKALNSGASDELTKRAQGLLDDAQKKAKVQ